MTLQPSKRLALRRERRAVGADTHMRHGYMQTRPLSSLLSSPLSARAFLLLYTLTVSKSSVLLTTMLPYAFA